MAVVNQMSEDNEHMNLKEDSLGSPRNVEHEEPTLKDKLENSKEETEATTKINAPTPENILEKSPNEQFKKPLLIGPQRGKNKLNTQNKPFKLLKEKEIHKDVQTNCTENSNSSSLLASNEDEDLKNVPPQQQKPTPPLPYKEPDWAGIPNHDYNLEELKSGTIVKTIDVSKRSFSVFGRLEHNDIAMLHPTVSRYHAVLQYRVAGDEQHEPGFYIYDLGSSLGTFLNKHKLKPRTYVRVKVGHVIKIGCSTRMFILQGPEDDEEPESDLTVTELKQQYQEKVAALEAEQGRLEAEREAEELETRQRLDERGIDWGMGEDADEETDLTENPYAQTLNEELYLDDPKKTLRGWFEREGEELEYDVEEKGFGHFICRIELPVDNGGGGNLVAEANVKGKKKEAVVQAALEACRLLDRQGLLRQSTHESKKRAVKDWEAVDFYDSDEDNFLDRTGQIEKKRQKRMAQSGKLETEVDTYETLVDKYNSVVKEMEETENKLNKMLSLAAQTKRQSEGEDDLDAYMNILSQQPVDKIEIKKIKNQVAKLRAEEARVRQLVNLTRPTALPPLMEPVAKPVKERKIEVPQVPIGKMNKKKRHHPETVLPLATTQQQPFSNDQEEFDDDEEKVETEDTTEGVDNAKGEAVCINKKKKSRPDRRNRTKKLQSHSAKAADDDYSTCTWTPPANQTGDGRTSLNDKLGY